MHMAGLRQEPLAEGKRLACADAMMAVGAYLNHWAVGKRKAQHTMVPLGEWLGRGCKVAVVAPPDLPARYELSASSLHFPQCPSDHRQRTNESYVFISSNSIRDFQDG